MPRWALEPRQPKGAGQIEKKGQSNPGHNQDQPVRFAQPIQFTEKKGGHESGLERPDAAAGFIDPDESGGKLNQIPTPKSRNATPIDAFDGEVPRA